VTYNPISKEVLPQYSRSVEHVLPMTSNRELVMNIYNAPGPMALQSRVAASF